MWYTMKELNLEEIDVILLNGINKEFKYIEEILGNSRGFYWVKGPR